MKSLFSILFVCLFIQTITAQINVFECNSYTNQITQAELNAVQEHFGTCISLAGTQSINVTGAANKAVYASKDIQLKENFYAGSFSASGGLRLVVKDPTVLDVAVINYSTLNQVSRYKKLEFGVGLPTAVLTRVNHFLLNEGTYPDELNPFLEWDVDVEATFFHLATQTVKTIDGYYHREYIENPITDDWDDVGTAYPFRIRYAPPQNGKWIAQITIKINGLIEYQSEKFGFHVVESGDPGYVKVHPNRKNLQRGTNMIFPVGHNFYEPDKGYGAPWVGTRLGNDLFGTQRTKATNTVTWDHYYSKVESYFQGGGKYIRTIQAPWCTLIEFEKKGNYYDRLHYAWEQDKLLDLCEQYDALMMFNLMIHHSFEERGSYDLYSWDWGKWIKHYETEVPEYTDTNPVYCYNDNPQETGGKQPYEALMLENDLKYHEQRTRYYIARYGYSTKIYEFELLSEPFNVGKNGMTGYQPYFNSTQQSTLFNAIETYHGRLSWYIKEKMNHTEHLLGVDYPMLVWEPHTHLIKMDQSLHHGNIDIIGINYYAKVFNKYIITKDPETSSNNNFYTDENSRARAFKEFQAWANKPVILSEFGDGDKVHDCSDYTGSFVDIMSAGFTGIAGYNLWEGGESNQNFLWPATIRAQHHMNGTDVITTLSNGNGQWVQGRQHEKLLIFSLNDKKEAVEQQYYISNNKERAVGYIRNRTYNVHTKRINSQCDLGIGNEEPVDDLTNIKWNDLLSSRRLKVEGLKTNTNYEVDFYSFKTGNYIYTDCDNTSLTEGKLTLRFPELTVEAGYNENPVVWFIIKQKNCNSGLITSENTSETRYSIDTDKLNTNYYNDNLEIYKTNIYPNPFDDYFVIDSKLEDLLIIQSVEGKIVYRQTINEGISKIDTKELLSGTYILKLVSQNIQVKVIKT